MKMVEDTSEDIVIVGGGICGLATALALHRKGIRSLVLERSESLRATGAAIVVHANGWRALDQLGVASYLRQTADPILSGQFNFLDSNKIEKMPVGKDELRCVKRTDLMNILADNLPLNTVRLGCNVVSIELDPITFFPVLQLQDGSSLNAKVVIGCDGVNSRISDMMGVMATKIFNLCATRGFTSYPSGHEFGSEFKLTIKDDIQVGLMPMATNLVYWFITRKYTSQKFKISQSQKLIGDMAAASVQDFPPSIKEMVENCSLESLHFSEHLRYQAPWDILRRGFRVGTIAVAGDAWHAMAPFIAQGGSASLEDAVVLARCLARKTINVGIQNRRASKTMLEEALDDYLKERTWRVLRLSLQSYLIAKMFDTSSNTVKFICGVLTATIFPEWDAHTRYDCGGL